ncbi:MAG TPA: lytic murein transglycosylase [Solirubrobacterales bacterium]|jgi:murein DD-endopeptidase MepM/ murein hydrolase activator NlpD|nr:lytic murein transglycosylase [Solirubrobacterales bacterium]
MKSKLAIILALAAFLGLAVAVGSATAARPLASVTETLLGGAQGAGSPSGSGTADTTTTPPSSATPGITPPVTTTPTAPAPQCSDGIDNDGDGLIDMEDPDCTSPSDNSEEAEVTINVAPPSQTSSPSTSSSGSEEEAEEEKSGKKKHKEFGRNESLEEEPQPDVRGGVTHNESLGDSSGGGNSGGGVKAPDATGGGDQPLGETSDGGAQFEPGGAPTLANPTTTFAPFGPAPIGVPNFVINSFEIPPFLLPIYQACGTEYGIPWEVLAAINKIETGFGTNLNVSSAGAVGWMQFLPSSWETYGLDANGDGRKDPYNPVDAICAAAHYLKVAGGQKDLYDAILAYNHADWYAQEVLTYARAYGRIPSDLVGSLTGLTEGAHFPIAANARYSDEIAARASLEGSAADAKISSNAAEVISSSPTPRGINIFAKKGSPVVAVNDGVIRKMGHSDSLGNFIVLEDTYGNRYTYAGLGKLVRDSRTVVTPGGKEKKVPMETQNLRPRLRALPERSGKKGKKEQKVVAKADELLEKAAGNGSIRVGSKVIAGTVLAHVEKAEGGSDPHINFSIRPAGKGAPRIDPKPILDGWKLLEATAIYRAKGKNPFNDKLSGAGVLLLSKEALQQRVLHDEGLDIYQCGREDIEAGKIDRRVLAVLEYLRSKGFTLRISALECGHSLLTEGGNVSEHSTGDAVDIAEINGVNVTGHQGPGTLVHQLIEDVLQLQGPMQPHQVISLEDFPGEVSFAEASHYDHVHIGYRPVEAGNPLEAAYQALLKPTQWAHLINRLGKIENPTVPIEPSKYSLPDKPKQQNSAEEILGGHPRGED